MKLFISQPMNGKTNEEIITERNEAIAKFDGAEVLDSFFKDAPHDANPLWYLSESLKIMSEADVVYFCKDWQKYRGCRIEHECAVAYGKEIKHAE